jgi:lysine 2,3-aminomutase
MNARRPHATLKTAKDLVSAGLIAPERREEAAAVAARYAIAVSPAAARLIAPGDSDDPIARQYLPDARELIRHPAEVADPIGDALKSPLSGLVHRYRDRVLIKLVAVCAVYCRFCFRREMIGPGAQALSAEEFAAALAYVRARPQIWEAVLTGGDPLVLSPRRLAETTTGLATIPHLKVLRWHTRLPVVAPERVTKAMARALCHGHDKTVYVALHANHPRELTDQARAACGRLIDAGATLVSQSVLLKGVNDDADTLEALMRAFVEARVKPYYLHHPDLAPGTAHFRAPIARGQALMRELRQRLSGLAMPTYVLDQPDAHGKTPIGPSYAIEAEEGSWRIVDAEGEARVYRDALPD